MSKKSFRDRVGTVFGPDAERVGPATFRDKARHSKAKPSKSSKSRSPKRGGWR